ncbi:hypothetical protein AAU57_03525 [Nonlabens sp. YIK11]|uniref:hypothetical protein n=1 Tax=Nonlabens sp. YIK11 TaxID=1453349 RepID=UPI0006DBF178|nr:hypothetical protein [Nonlabens sp. YIK11]KQC32506.1 hypothetical protein AAU57_03525 [Nonlabens sp. YIK11]
MNKLPFSEFKSSQSYHFFIDTILKSDSKSRYQDLDNSAYNLELRVERSLLDDTGQLVHDEATLRQRILDFIDIEEDFTKNVFIDRIESNLYLTPENISHLANNLISYLQKLSRESYNSFIKDRNITDKLVSAIASINDLLSEYAQNPYPKNLVKMDFNLNRSTLTYFFCVLRERNIINRSISNADLSRFLQFTTRYSSNEKKHYSMKGVASLISDFGSQNGEKSQVNAANELEKLFDNDGFFLI